MAGRDSSPSLRPTWACQLVVSLCRESSYAVSAHIRFTDIGTPAGKGVDEPAPLATETSPGNDGDLHGEGATDVVPPATEASTANDRNVGQALSPEEEGAAEVATEEEGVLDAAMTDEEGVAGVVMTEEEGVYDAVMTDTTEEEGGAEAVQWTSEIAQSMDIDGENLTSPNGTLWKKGSVADLAIKYDTGGYSNGEAPSPSTHTAGLASEEGSADGVPATDVVPLMAVGDPGSNLPSITVTGSDEIGTDSLGPAVSPVSGVLDRPIGTACSNHGLTPNPLVIDHKCSRKVQFDEPPMSPLTSMSSSGPPSPSSPIHSPPPLSELNIAMTLFEKSYNGRCEHLKMLHDHFLADVIKNVETESSRIYPYDDAAWAASIPESSIRADNNMFSSRGKLLRLLTFVHHHVVCAEQPCYTKQQRTPCYFLGKKTAATLARGFGQNLEESLQKSGCKFTSAQGTQIVHDLFRKVFEKEGVA
ncbi:hypothetical protein C8R47DRAFT_79174 [Mycena vitilis]|nr:hypothetical protein C8R47DRAFT_79174 [Mycena vitilis]